MESAKGRKARGVGLAPQRKLGPEAMTGWAPRRRGIATCIVDGARLANWATSEGQHISGAPWEIGREEGVEDKVAARDGRAARGRRRSTPAGSRSRLPQGSNGAPRRPGAACARCFALRAPGPPAWQGSGAGAPQASTDAMNNLFNAVGRAGRSSRRQLTGRALQPCGCSCCCVVLCFGQPCGCQRVAVVASFCAVGLRRMVRQQPLAAAAS
jgi:hypothetical protein